MRIVVDCGALRSAGGEEKEYFRDLLRTLLGKGSDHTYHLADWPESACGDCAAFLSPFPRGAAAWSVETSPPRARRNQASRKDREPGTLRYFPFGAPTPDRLDVLEGPALVTIPEIDGTENRETYLRLSASSGIWAHVWTRVSAERLERSGFARERIKCISPPAGPLCRWDIGDSSRGRPTDPYVAVSVYGLRVRELARILRGLALASKEHCRRIAVTLFGRAPLGIRAYAKAFGKRAVRSVDVPRSRALPLLASARVFVAASSERRAWFWIGDALSQGVPILAPNHPGLFELLGDSALYYPASGRGRIPSGLWHWFLGEVTARILSRRAIARSSYLCWDNFVMRLLDLFAEIARDGRTRTKDLAPALA